MAKLLKLRRGTTTQHGSFTGAEGEVTVDTDKETLVVHDGSTAGGHPVAAEDMANVSAANIKGRLGTTLTNAEINASAAIAGTKIAADFGSQDVSIQSDSHKFLGGASEEMQLFHDGTNTVLKDTRDSGKVRLQADTFDLIDKDASTTILAATDSTITSHKNHDFSAGIDVTGNITVSGTVDGRDVATDGTKLDGIEASATADQTAAEIRTLVESASDSNVFTDADHTKLNGIEASATADQTGGEIATALNGQNLYTTGSIGRDSTDYFTFTDNTQCDLFINASNEFRFEADGDFHADGDVIAQSTTISSDAKLKEDIELVPDALGKLNQLNGVTFKWKRSNEKSAGVIAQDVQKVLPEAVKEVTALSNGETHLSVNYHALTSILIEAVKELQAEVEKLKGGK